MTDDLHGRYEAVLAEVTAPFAFVDLDALWTNATDMVRRAAGTPIRVASKSIRCRDLLGRIHAHDPAFRGVLGFTLPEALWLHDHGVGDVVVAYPTVDVDALAALVRRGDDPTAPVVTVDHVAHLELVDRARQQGAGDGPVRVCLDVDAGMRVAGRVHVGPKRSPVHDVDDAVALARAIVSRPGMELVGIMAYEGQIAGVGDRPSNRAEGVAIRAMQRVSATELRARRGRIVAAVREVADLAFVNGGGTGSLELTAADASVTELAAGSGFYAPHLFDHYDRFTLRPAAGFALPVVRRPGPGVVTALGGGYLASGAADRLRLPVPWLPAGLSLDSREGAGEVQTPLRGDAADRLAIGDRVYFRHGKAGELCERFATLHLVEGGRVVDEVPTYRGEGRTFL